MTNGSATIAGINSGSSNIERITSMLSEMPDTKSFILSIIVLNIIFLVLSYGCVCLIGILYNKWHAKSTVKSILLGSKYRIITFLICVISDIVFVIHEPLYVGSGLRGAIMAVDIVITLLVCIGILTDDPENQDSLIYAVYWSKGKPNTELRFNIYIKGKPIFKAKKQRNKNQEDILK